MCLKEPIAYGHAKKDALHSMAEPVPLVIRNAPTHLMKDLDYGKGYRYAHDEADKVAAGMQCLPDSLAGTRYYVPTEEGREGLFKERLDRLRRCAPKQKAKGRRLLGIMMVMQGLSPL